MGSSAISVSATGALTLHGVTKCVLIPLQATLAGGVVTVIGTLQTPSADCSIAAPQSTLGLLVADTGTLELQLHLTRA